MRETHPGAPAASRRRVGNQQSRAARPGPGAHPWQGWLRPHGRLVHPRCKCAPCRFLDPRTGTRTTQVPATKSCLTSPGNRASAARTGLPAALHARYFRKSPIWAPKSPPARRLPPNVADQVHLTLNPPVRSGSNLTAEAGSNSKKGVFGRHYIVLAQKPIRVILINELGSGSDGEVCAVVTRSSVGRSLSLV